MTPRVFLIAAVVGAGCGSNHEMGSMMTGSRVGTELLSVSPRGGATGVSVDGSFAMSFSQALLQGMEQYVDLHEGDLDGPLVPIRCGWSSDRIGLACTPDAPLRAHMRYTLHVGSGMMDADHHPVDLGLMGPQMGGQWAPGAPHHGSMMGNGWRGSNGSYGICFSFTTA